MFEHIVEVGLHPIVGLVNILAQAGQSRVEDACTNVFFDMCFDRTSAQHMRLDDLYFVNDFRLENIHGAGRGRFRALNWWALGLRRRALWLRWLLLLGSALSGAPQEFLNVAGHVVFSLQSVARWLTTSR
jgi:hypothetical protein